MAKLVQLDEYRPHDEAYVACMKCARDWVAVFPLGVKKLECPSCHELEGEPVQIHNLEWFKRFMAGDAQRKRTMVCLNAKRMEGA